jgi:hypothetical protein
MKAGPSVHEKKIAPFQPPALFPLKKLWRLKKHFRPGQ